MASSRPRSGTTSKRGERAYTSFAVQRGGGQGDTVSKITMSDISKAIYFLVRPSNKPTDRHQEVVMKITAYLLRDHGFRIDLRARFEIGFNCL